MRNPRRTGLLMALRLLDMAVVVIALVVAIGAAVEHEGAWLDVLQMRIRVRNVAFLSLYLLYWHAVLSGSGLYRSYRLAPSTREWRDLGVATLVGTLPLWLSADLLRFQFATPRFFVLFIALAFVGLATERRCLRAVARSMRRHGRNLRNVVIVGDGEAGFALASRLVRRADLGYNIVEEIDVGGSRDEGTDGISRVVGRLERLLERQPVDEVFLALPLDAAQAILHSVVAMCEERGVAVRVLSSFVNLLFARAQVDEIDGQPVITIFTGPPDSVQLLAKRVIDIAVSATVLVLLLPLFAVIALAIRLDSPGPALFMQERVGLGGRRFRLYKFRTMVEGSERMQEVLEPLNEAHGPVFKIRSDPRVTRLGHLIRRYSIDELLQLLNVLKGEMSLVGPRPLPLRDVARIDVAAHKRRISVKPGITCLWQVSAREPEFDAWIRSDMEYIDNWSLVLDTKILARTIPAVLSGRGAY